MNDALNIELQSAGKDLLSNKFIPGEVILSLLGSLDCKFLVVDKNYQVKWANNDAIDVLGYLTTNDNGYEKTLSSFVGKQADGTFSKSAFNVSIDEAYSTGKHETYWQFCNAQNELVEVRVKIIGITGKRSADPDLAIAILHNSQTKIVNPGFTASSFKLLIDSMPLCLNLWNKNADNILCNKQVLNLFNLTDEKDYLFNFFKFSPEIQPNGCESVTLAKNYIQKAFDDGYCNFKWLHQDLQGNEIPCEITLTKINFFGNNDFVAGFTRDMRTEFMGSESNAHHEEYFLNKISDKTLLNTISSMSNEWFFAFDIRTSLIQFFGNNITHLGLDVGTLYSLSYMQDEGKIHEDDLELYQTLISNMAEGKYEPLDIRFSNSEGVYRYHTFTYQTVATTDDEPIFVVGKISDIHEQKKLEERSKIDLLTGCYNKISAENIASEKLLKLNEGVHALFIIDVDNFKAINDNLGHFFGDQVLKEVSADLKSFFRTHDVIARIGGDEFVVFMENVPSKKVLEAKANSILEAFSKTYVDDYAEYSISGSIGIALYPDAGMKYEDLYKAADKALYKSKQQGKNCYVIYDDSIQNIAIRGLTKLESANRLTGSSFDYDAIADVFEILYSRNADSVSINTALKYIGKKYSSSRCYIFETFDKGQTYSKTFEWCETDTLPNKDNMQNLDKRIFKEYFEDAVSGVIYTNDFDFLKGNTEAYDLIKTQDIKSFIHLQAKKGDYISFFLGLDDCQHARIWGEREINSLHYISKVVSIIRQGELLKYELNSITQDTKISAYLEEKNKAVSEAEAEVLEVEEKLREEQLINSCIETLNENESPNAAITKLLKIIAEFHEAERCYIFENNDDGITASNTYEWCAEGIVPQIHNLQNLKKADFSSWFEMYDISGQFYIDSLNDEVDKNSTEYKLLDAQGISSLSTAAIKDKNNVVSGFIGVDNPKTNIKKVAILSSASKFVSSFLIKNKLLENLQMLSYYDTLTKIKNRHSYMLALQEIDVAPMQSLGVAYIDISNLKNINDMHGVAFGDNVLIKLANMLKELFADNCYRVGGDEFVCIVKDISELEFEANIKTLKAKIEKSEDFSISIGYTWNKNIHESQSSQLLKHGTRYKEILLSNLLKEIQNDKFVVYLQPQINMNTNNVTGAEALIRRLGADGFPQAPISFLPFYEKEGIVYHLDLFVMEEVCKTLQKWQNHKMPNNLKISVNCSRMTIIQKDIVKQFSEICKKYNVPTSNIVIEITETINGVRDDILATIIHDFSFAGFDVSLDDFGSGYSNLNSLMISDFDELKIDMSIIRDLAISDKSKALTKVALNICDELDEMVTVAEGIETATQYEILRNLRCQKGQGYYFDKPMPSIDFEKKYILN